MAPLRTADQSRVLATLAKALMQLPCLASHDFFRLAMAHHDLPWPPDAAASLLRRIGWLPPDAREALEMRVSSVGSRV